MTSALASTVDSALETLARLPTTTGYRQPPCVRTTAVFGHAPTNISLPLNRKTTQQAITTMPVKDLEPRQEFVPVQGLKSYIIRPRRDPPDVARVKMRDGRVRLFVQEGHTRLGAAVLRGDEEIPIRVWEFEQTTTGGFAPVVRGRQRIYERIRDRPYADRLKQLAEEFELGGPGSGNFGHAGRPGEQGGSGPGGGSGAIHTRERDDDGFVKFEAGGGRTTAFIPDVVAVLKDAGLDIGHHHTGGGPKSDRAEATQGAVVDYRRDWDAPSVTSHTYVTHAGKGRAEAIPKYAEALRKAGVDVTVAPLDRDRPERNTKDVVWINPVPKKKLHADVMSLPSVSDVNFPTLIGAIPAKPRKKRKRVKYKGVSLSRRPMEFEIKVLSLAEIPPRLDAAVFALENPDAPLLTTLTDIARFGTRQALLELVRQGAPDTIMVAPPTCEDAIEVLAAQIDADRARDLNRAFDEHTENVSRRRLSRPRALALVRELTSRWAPGIIKRHAKRAVNMAFALGRAAVVDHYRRPRTQVDLASRFDKLTSGSIWVDAVIQTAVMDTNTCDECEEVDGEQMELGEDRQEELHPPYVKCLGGDRCRCVQIALLSDGSEIDVDEVPEEAYDDVWDEKEDDD